MLCRLTALGTLLLLACAGPTSPRDELIGQWKSDRVATLEELDGHAELTNDQRELLEGLLGHLTIEYTGETISSSLDDWNSTGPYTVVSQGLKFVDIRRQDALSGKMKLRRVWVDGNRMRIWVDSIGFHEHFTRIQ